MGKRTAVLLLVIAMALSSLGGPWGEVEKANDIGRSNTTVPVPEPIPNLEPLLEGLGEHFVENRGQLSDPEIRFYATGDPLSIGLTPRGLMYNLLDDRGVPATFSLSCVDCLDVE